MRASPSLGLCPAECLVPNSRLISATILGSEATEDAVLSSRGEVLVSGYWPGYQPIRALHAEARLGRAGLQLECEDCEAVVTVEADTNNTECGNNEGGETYCVAQQQTKNLGNKSS